MTNRPMEKAVILARGLGTRMRRADDGAGLDSKQAAVAATGVKALMPVAVGRPFLDYVLSSLAAAGYRRVCLVVAPEHEALRRYYHDEAPCARIELDFAGQQEPKGTADAVLAAESFAGDDPFLVVNSDNYYPQEALAGLCREDGLAVALFERESMLAGSNVDEDRLTQFAIGQISDDGFLERIVEKPDRATLDAVRGPIWLSMNCWRFGPAIFEACRSISPSARGELEIPTAVAYTIDVLGQPFRAVRVRAAVLDLTGRTDVAAVAARLKDVEVDY